MIELVGGADLVRVSEVIEPAELNRLPSAIPVEFDPTLIVQAANGNLSTKEFAAGPTLDRNALERQMAIALEHAGKRPGDFDWWRTGVEDYLVIRPAAPQERVDPVAKI